MEITKPNNNWAIKLKNVSKTFYIPEDKKESIKSLFVAMFNQGRTKSFRALKNIDLEIERGEFIGIVGKNGSGKSTLLKIIAGIYNPDRGGKVYVNGKIMPFLELGVGFNPEFSGRQNVFLNGTILGMSRKYIKSKYQQIVEFAELEEFMEMPVKNYSSGMVVRLAFAIAIQSDADIYILDEILAVGDSGFQKKSLAVIKNLKAQGKTVLYVSHGMGSIQELCDRAILIDEHEIKAIGNPEKVSYEYEELFRRELTTEVQVKDTDGNDDELASNINPEQMIKYNLGGRKAEIVSYELFNAKHERALSFQPGEEVTFKFKAKFKIDIDGNIVLGVMIRDNLTYPLFGIHSTSTQYPLDLANVKNGDIYEFSVTTPLLVNQGSYYVSFYLTTSSMNGLEYEDLHSLINYEQIDVITAHNRWGRVYNNPQYTAHKVS